MVKKYVVISMTHTMSSRFQILGKKRFDGRISDLQFIRIGGSMTNTFQEKIFNGGTSGLHLVDEIFRQCGTYYGIGTTLYEEKRWMIAPDVTDGPPFLFGHGP